MKAFEFPVRVTSDKKLEIPDTISEQLPVDQEVRVIILVSETRDAEDQASWSGLTAEQFLKGYSEADSIYDKI